MRRKLTITIIIAVHLTAFLPSTVMANNAIHIVGFNNGIPILNQSFQRVVHDANATTYRQILLPSRADRAIMPTGELTLGTPQLQFIQNEYRMRRNVYSNGNVFSTVEYGTTTPLWATELLCLGFFISNDFIYTSISRTNNNGVYECAHISANHVQAYAGIV